VASSRSKHEVSSSDSNTGLDSSLSPGRLISRSGVLTAITFLLGLNSLFYSLPSWQIDLLPIVNSRESSRSKSSWWTLCSPSLR
jgi:hypothetical protein